MKTDPGVSDLRAPIPQPIPPGSLTSIERAIPGVVWKYRPHAASFRFLYFSQASRKDEPPDFQRSPALLVTRTVETHIRCKAHGSKSAHSVPIVWEQPSKSFLSISKMYPTGNFLCLQLRQLNLYLPLSCLHASTSFGPAVFVFWPIYCSLLFSLMNSKLLRNNL